jgi:putative spermidine/putrescine transport system permease protein
MSSRTSDLSYCSIVWIVALFAMLLLFAPTVVVLIASFTGAQTLRFPPPSWSLRWYTDLLHSDELIAATWTSLTIAFWATLACGVLGTAAALGIARSRSAWARFLDGLFMSPLVLPAMALGLALLMVFSLLAVRLSIWTLTVGHVVICTPFVIRMVSAAVQQLNPVLDDCSLSLGASRFYTLRRITLPLISRGICAGSFVAFLSSFDHVPVSLFLADARTEVLPIKLWQILEASLDVRVAAVSGVIVIVTLAGLIVAERFFKLAVDVHEGS